MNDFGNDTEARAADLCLKPWMAYAILCCFALAAYLPTAWHYRLFADDLVLFKFVHGNYMGFFHAQGIWRILGLQVSAILKHLSPTLDTVITIFVHALNCLMLYRALCLLQVSGKTALALALVCASFPGYHEAIAWSDIYVWSTCCFMLLLSVLLKCNAAGALPGRVFLISVFISFIGNIICEQLAFAYAALPILLLGFNWDGSRAAFSSAVRRIAPSFGAVLGAIIYVALFQLTSTPDSIKKPHFNFGSILSTYYYQHANIYAYEVWRYGPLRKLLCTQLSPAILLVSFCFGALGLAAAAYFILQHNDGAPTARLKQKTFAPDKWIWSAALLALLSGVSFVYAVGGGYSLDSRKRYSVIILLVFCFGSLLPLFRTFQRKWMQAWLIGGLLLLAVFDVPTAWLLTAARNWQIERSTILLTQVERGEIPDHTFVEAYSQPGVDWTRLRTMWAGFDDPESFFINGYDSTILIAQNRESASHLAVWREDKQLWVIEPRQK
ncbi:MAG: hypothetical protein PHD76_04100 [Methylacidiphilales bacterium]|nr:hypothetical protein [Candidatus Methylacidiphilales bacterium]